jgi:hypothetical protein
MRKTKKLSSNAKISTYSKKITHTHNPFSIFNMTRNVVLVSVIVVAMNAKGLRLSGGNAAEYWVYIDEELEALNYKEHLEDKLQLNLANEEIAVRGIFFISDPSLPNPNRLSHIDYSIQYTKSPVSILYGRFHETFARGLVLNQYIDEDFKLDNSLQGLKVDLDYYKSLLTLLAGHPRNMFFEENTYRIKNANDSTAQIRGVDFRTKLVPMTTFGASYVRINTEIDLTPKSFTELFGGSIDFKSGPFDAYLEYARHLGAHPGVGGRLDGYGVLFSAGLALPGLGISFQAMDYDSIGVGGPGYRYNEPVTPIKSGTSVNRGTDEIGFGASILFSLSDYIAFEIDNNKISTHDTTLSRIQQMFVTNESMDAVIEQAIEIIAYPRYELEITGGIEKLVKQGIEAPIETKTETKPYIETIYDFGTWFIEAAYEHNFTSADTSDYYDQAIAVAIGKPELFIITLRYERRNRAPQWLVDLGKIDDDTTWPLAELSLDLTARHNLRIRAGAEKGGLVCSGGVCRFEEPFKGVKLVLTSIF